MVESGRSRVSGPTRLENKRKVGIDGFLTTLGESFVSNRSVALFIIILLVTGTLERNGLKQAAAALIGRAKGATPGIIIARPASCVWSSPHST